MRRKKNELKGSPVQTTQMSRVDANNQICGEKNPFPLVGFLAEINEMVSKYTKNNKYKFHLMDSYLEPAPLHSILLCVLLVLIHS